MNRACPTPPRRRALAGLALLALAAMVALAGGCSSLLPQALPLPASFTLDGPASAATTAATTGADTAPATSTRPAGAAADPAARRPALAVSPPHAAAGFDSQHMVYLRTPHQLEYFARHQWVDTPARMLTPLIVSALERSAGFGAVVRSPGAADAELRLDTDIVRLQQQFDSGPSRVRFTLRAQLMDSRTRQVLAWREFDASVAAPSDDPAGGVLAANAAVQAVLTQLAQFCAESAAARPAAAPSNSR